MNMSVELIILEQKIFEVEMEEFFELDDWDFIFKLFILLRV